MVANEAKLIDLTSKKDYDESLSEYDKAISAYNGYTALSTAEMSKPPKNRNYKEIVKAAETARSSYLKVVTYLRNEVGKKINTLTRL